MLVYIFILTVLNRLVAVFIVNQRVKEVDARSTRYCNAGKAA